jgi:hypothetical protein
MSTLNQFVGLGTSLTITNLTVCITKTFDTTAPLGSRPLGGGGFLICKASSNAWIVSPRCAEVSRTWYCRDDANTVANLCTSCTGWFVPTVSQLQNPGYCCRTYWDLFSSTTYWSSTGFTTPSSCIVNFTNGNAGASPKDNTYCVRAFRCVTY